MSACGAEDGCSIHLFRFPKRKMILDIKYGKKYEFDRIKHAISKLDWYKSEGYDINKLLRLPRGIEHSSDGEIKAVVEREFREDEYAQRAREIKNDFPKIEKDFIAKLKRETKMDVPEKLEIFLTKYGSGGSYNLPNRITLNIAGNGANKPLIEVLKHELAHLVMEPEVQRKKLSHRDKEALVNGILEHTKL